MSETIYQRGDTINRNGGADFHIGNPELTSEEIIKATRKAQEVAIGASSVIGSANKMLIEPTIIPFPTPEKPLTQAEIDIQQIRDCTTLVKFNQNEELKRVA